MSNCKSLKQQLRYKNRFGVYFFFLHILLFCTFYSIAHFTLISLFYHIYALVLCYFYIILIFYSFALSTERTWFDYISLLIIPCIIYYVTNKETLNLELQTISFAHPYLHVVDSEMSGRLVQSWDSWPLSLPSLQQLSSEMGSVVSGKEKKQGRHYALQIQSRWFPHTQTCRLEVCSGSKVKLKLGQ